MPSSLSLGKSSAACLGVPPNNARGSFAFSSLRGVVDSQDPLHLFGVTTCSLHHIAKIVECLAQLLNRGASSRSRHDPVGNSLLPARVMRERRHPVTMGCRRAVRVSARFLILGYYRSLH